jgi:hypothetical protein
MLQAAYDRDKKANKEQKDGEQKDGEQKDEELFESEVEHEGNLTKGGK